MNRMYYITGRDPKHFPEIGKRLPVTIEEMKLEFQIDGYGDGREMYVFIGGLQKPAYELELFGHIVIPKGSPVEYFNKLFGLTDEEDKMEEK